jgi:flagellar hook-associated protein 3 FlgL
MTQRITPQMQSATLLANINNDLTSLDHTQDELSTGLKIMQPSDDPYGSALAIQLKGQLAAMDSYTSNVNDGTAWANTASSALISIQQAVQTARTLIVESNNGIDNSSDLASAADEINELIDSIKQTANTQYNGQYVFSGTATTTQPYLTGTGASDTFQGNTGAINRSIGPGTNLQVNVDLSAVLGNGMASGDGGLLDTLETVAQDLTTNNTANLGNDLASIDTNISSLEGAQAQIGAAQDRLQMAGTRITGLQTTDQTQLSNTEDVDMAQASIDYSTQQAGYSAALQSAAQIIQTSLLDFLKS